MNHTHITLRLPEKLARDIATWARARGVPKSQLVREAVASYGQTGSSPALPVLTARDLAARWRSVPRLTTAEAADFAADIADGRSQLPPAPAPWE